MKIGGLLVSLFLISLFSCKKDDGDRIPEVYVRYDISKIEFDQNDVNGVLLVNGHGVAGLILYKTSNNTYKAYDRCSSVDPAKKCAVVPDESFTVTDPCSGAKFFLMDGSPAKAPAVRSLKEYRVLTTSFQIMISNDYGS
jgi:hypothetical protein